MVGVTLGVIHILSLDKFVITYIYYYSIDSIQSVFTALNILLPLPFHPSLPSNLIYCLKIKNDLLDFSLFHLVNPLEL